MSTLERRSAPRFAMRIPIRYRLSDSSETREIAAESTNISRCGIYFSTDHVLEKNTLIQILMKLPREVTLGYTKECLVTGRVVHVQAPTDPGGDSGVGVHFLYYELTESPAAPQRSEEWQARLRASA